jgi:hypothetical protein
MIKLFSVKVCVKRGREGFGRKHAKHTSLPLKHSLNTHSPQRLGARSTPQDKQKKEAAAAAAGKPKQSAGELRLQKGA